jgi:hypothetical protein
MQAKDKSKAEQTVELSVNIFKKVLLFLDVSAYKFARSLPGFGSEDKNKSFSFLTIVLGYFVAGQYLFKDFHNLLIFLGFAAAIHAVVTFLFKKEIVLMVADYNRFYYKIGYYLFLLYMAFVAFYLIVDFNSSIGHVSGKR